MKNYYSPAKSLTSNSSTSASSLPGKAMKTSLLIALMLFLSMSNSWAAIKNATVGASQTWAALWAANGGVPVAGDDVTLTCNGAFNLSAIPASVPATGNFLTFTTTGTGTLTLTGATTTVFTNRLNVNANTTLASLSFNQTALTSASSGVLAAKTLTIPNLCFVGIGTGGVLTVNGSVAINGNATGLLTSAASNVVVSSTGAVTYTLTGQACQPAAMTVQSGGSLTITASSASTISQFPSPAISMAGTLTIGGNIATVGGSNNISYTGTPTLRYTNTVAFAATAKEFPATGVTTVVRAGTAGIAVTLGGNISRSVTTLTMTTGTLTIPASNSLAVTGASTWTSGIINVTGSNLTCSGAITQAGTPVNVSGGTYELTGTGTHALGSGTLALTSTGVLLLTTTAATPITRTSGTITASAGTTVSFSPASAQNWTLPAGTIPSTWALSTLTLATGSTGSITLNNTFDITVSTNFNLTSGLTILGTGHLQVAGSASYAGTAGVTNMIVTSSTSGYFKRSMVSNGTSYTFPVGENVGTAEYAGFTLNLASGAASQFIGFRVIDANPIGLGTQPDYISRYWQVFNSTAGAVSATYSLPYNGTTGDINGTEANMVPAWSTGGGVWNVATGGTTNTGTDKLDFSAGDVTTLGNTKYITGIVVGPGITLTAPGSTSACYSSSSSFNLAYTATTGSPDEYNLVWNTAAATAGFVNEPSSNASNTACGTNFISLPATPIVVSIPAGIMPGTYTGYINPRNSTSGLDNCGYNGVGLASCPSFSITITSVAAPTGATPQGFCPGYTVADLVATGTGIQWYAAATGGSPLAGSTALVSGNHYYASQTVSGCESTSRLDVTVVTPLAGTIPVGAGQTYTTLSGAGGLFSAINTNGVGGNITARIVSNITETGAVALNQWTEYCGSGYTLTIVPDDATLKTLSGAVTIPLINLNGADNVTFDGRFNATGTTSYLTISNTNASGNAFRFTNDAKNNTIEYCSVMGRTTSQSSGVIDFTTANASGTGNTGNVIDNCNIGDASLITALANNMIYSAGTAAKANSNTVSNNNIFNYYSLNTPSIGISLAANNNAWTITGNKFYQTFTRTATGGVTHKAISISSGGGHTISNNVIGFGAADGTGTTTYNGAVANRFIGIELSGAAASEIQGNTIAGITLSTSSGATTVPGIFTGIYVSAGAANIGNTSANNIGTSAGNGGISITATTSLGYIAAISSNAATTVDVDIENNNIGYITTGGTAAIGYTFYGVHAAGAGNFNISGNAIGNASTDAIRIGTSGTTTTGVCNVAGIFANNSGSLTASGNVLNNISEYSPNISSFMYGINAPLATSLTMSLNSITNIKTTSTNTASYALIGLYSLAPATGQLIERNTIGTLTSNSSANLVGIFIGNTNGNGSLTRNKVGDIISSYTGAGILGIALSASSATGWTVSNNMVSITNAANATSATIYGIYDASASGSNRHYFNSVYIGGTTTGAFSSYALARGGAVTVAIKNNLLVNDRSGGTGFHYAIANNWTTPATGWSATASNNNVLNSTTGAIGRWNATTNIPFATWQTTSGGDAISVSGIGVTFTNTATVDLKLNMGTTPTSIESGAVDVSINVDQEGDARPGPTGSVNGGGSVPDIGADEFDGVALDVFPPVITYTPVSAGCALDYILTATITDATGVPTSGSTRPTIHYKKSTDTWGVSSYSAQGTLASGNASNGTWEFTITAADMSLAGGETVNYFVIAQDAVTPTPNIASSPSAGLVASDVNTISTYPTTPNSYVVNPTLAAGTYTVGSGGTYATLTAAVAAYNNSCLTGPVVFSLISPIYGTGGTAETFPIIVNHNVSASAVNTLTIKPTGTTSIIGSNTTALLVLNGADYVTIDGSTGSTANTVCPASAASRDLTIRNTNSTFNSALPQSVIWIGTASSGGTGGATYNTVKNCIVQSGSTSVLIGIGIGGAYNSGAYYTLNYGGGNNYNSIINNQVTATSAGANALVYGVIIQGGSASAKDLGNVVNQNLIGNASATTAQAYVEYGGIIAGWQDGITISGNTLRGIYSSGASVCGIGLGVVNTAGGGLVNIPTNTLAGNEVTNPVITNNILAYVGLAGTNDGLCHPTTNYGVAGIVTCATSSGTTEINSNMIGGVYGVPGYDDGTFWINYTSVAGLLVGGGGTTNIYHNTISNSISYSNGYFTTTYAIGIGGSNPVVNIKNNIFHSAMPTTLGSCNSYYSIAIATASSSFSNMSSDYNNFYATGYAGSTWVGMTGALDHALNGANVGTMRTTLADWQTATGGDANSKSVFPTFITPTSDLRLNASNSTNLTNLGGTGTPIATVTTDIDCQTRDVLIPDMGAEEFAAKNDASIIAISTSCSGLQTVTATIKNPSSSITLNTVDVTWSVDAVSQGTVSFSGLSLAPGASVVQTLGTYTFAAGPHTVIATSSLPNGVADANTSNDTYTQTGYTGLPATVYVGTGAGSPAFSDFNTLFGVINGSGLTADLTVLVQNSVTEPSTPTFLNATAACSGGPYHIYIQPASATTYTISGSTGSTAYPGMIGFNGSSLVTVDGQYSSDGNKWLKFRNTNSIYPAVTFINGSNNISISNSTIESNNSTTYVSGTLTNKPGTVFFGNASASVANSTITISNNDIRDRSDATGIPANGIFSLNSVASLYNNTISITDNNFYNFSQCGVYISPTGNGASWNISDNKFYNPSDLASYEGSVPQQISIYISAGSTCHSNTISGNTIGGSTSSNSGTWVNSLGSLNYEGIRLDIGGTGGQTTTVSNNIIKNISLTGTGLSNFIGIRVKNGLVDITGNTIGDLSATFASPSIQCNGNGTNGAGDNNNSIIYGIWSYSTSASTISNNTVAGIRGGSSATSGGWAYLTGIRRGAKEFGTNSLVQYAGQTTISNNTVANLFSNTVLSANFISGVNIDLVWPGALSGIAVGSNYAGGNAINDNNIYNLNAYGNWNRWVKVMGIAANGDPSSPVDNGAIYNNKISNLSNYNGGLAWTPQISGIEIGYLNATGSFNVYNNMIGLYPNNSDAGSNSSDNDMDLYGILDVVDASHSNTNKFYNNTVYLAGANLSGGVAKDYAYFRCGGGDGSTNGGTTYLKNNILINNRTGGGTHYAIGNQGSTPSVGFSAANIDYNFFSTLNTSTVGNKQVGAIGFATSTDYSFTGWQSEFSTDASTLYAQVTTGTSNYSTNPATATVNPTAGNLFIDPTDIVTSGSFLHADITDAISYQFISDNGVDLSSAGVSADIDGGSRTSTPDKGADEFVATPPANSITLTAASFGPFCNSSATNNISLNYTTTGTVTAPYIELSNASGSFASGTTNLGGTVTAGSPNNITVNLPLALAAGTYRVRIKSTDATPVISGDNGSNITVTALPTASISYAGTPFCTSLATAQSVTLTGSGGSFPAVSGLSLNSGTGAITPSTSTPGGPYTVNYVIPASGGCAQVTASTSVTITALPTATISYAGSPFCASLSTPQSVTLTGSGGTFPAVSGLTLNSSTGEITPSTSTPGGPYTVNYEIPASGGCAQVTASTSVTINNPPATVTFTAATSTNNSLAPCLVSNNYTIDPQSGYTYTWSVPSGWGSVSGGSTAQITVTPSLAAGNVTASVSIAGCTAASASLSVTPVTVPSAPIANPVLGVGTSPQTTGITNTTFLANWAAVSGATGYNLDVSTSSTFTTSSAAITEGFEGVTFPPTGWANTGWARSTTAGDFLNGIAAAVGSSNNGTLTTPVVANPTNMTFYLGRSSNATAKTLTIEVSTTSQSSGFSTVATYDHSNVTASSYNQYTVDLSAYTANSTVYIRFNKTSSTTSPWRLDDVVVNASTPSYVSGYQDLSVSGTSQTVSGLSAGVTYYYRLRASNVCGTSSNSNVVSVTTRALTATTLSTFGTRCFTSSTDLSFDLSGVSLDGTDVTIGPLTGFEFSANGGAFGTTATYSGYGTSFTNIPITVRFLPTGSGLVSFDGNIPASGGGATSINIAATASGTDAPAQPTITAGNLTPCPSSVGTYSVTNVAGVTYAWTLPSGWSGTSTTNSISATASATQGSSGTISVVPSIGLCAGTAQTWNETVTTLPSQPSVISTPGSPCAGSTGNVYSVTSVGGVTYTWAVSGTGWSIPSASTTNSVTITAGSANGGITVTPYVNGCAGPTRTLTGISVVSSFVPTVSIANSATAVCTNSSNTFTATRTDGNGGTPAYSWKLNGTEVSTSNPYTATAGTFANGDAIRCDMTVTGSCAVPSTVTSNILFAQNLAYDKTTVWTETFGTGTAYSSPNITGYTGYTNGQSPAITWTMSLPNYYPEVTTTNPSTNYFNGGANPIPASSKLYFATTGTAGGTYSCTMNDINTSSAFPNVLSFWLYNDGFTVDRNAFAIDYSIDGTNFYAVNYTATSGTTGWYYTSITNAFPPNSNVRLRFTQKSGAQVRIDGLKLEKYSVGDASVSASPTPPFCGSGSTTITATPTAASGLTYAWNNGSLFSPANPTINNPTTTTITSSGSVVTTNFTTTITDVFGCTSEATQTVVVNPAPTVYTVTGTGAYCSGGSGLNVGINSSQTAVNYQLYFNGNPQGSPVAGTGNPSQSLFGAQTAAGTYTIEATHSTSSCSATMTGSAVITVNPLPTAYTLSASASSYCLGGSGVTLSLDNSQTNTDYQLLLNGNSVGSPVSGTGSGISFGAQIAAGTYTVSATNTSLTPNCSSTMTGSPVVTVNPIASVQLGGSTAIFTQAFTSGLPAGWSINTPSGSSYDWSATNTSVSTGYTGASGGNNFVVATMAFGANATTTSQLISQNYNITGYSNISVLWGARKTNSYPGNGTFYFSTDNGSNWTQAAFVDVTGDSIWDLVNGGVAVGLSLPPGATSLKLRWDAEAVTTTSNYRIDDVSVYGLANINTCNNLSSVAINYAASANSTGYTLTAGSSALANFVTQSGTLSSGGGTVSVVIPSGSTAGSYDFNLNLTNGSSCNSTHLVPIVIAPAPTVTAVLDECAYIGVDKDIVLVTGSGGTGTLTFTSSNVADVALPSISSLIVPFEAPTDGLSRTYTATDAAGCSSNSSAVVTYNNHPTDIPYVSATGTKTVDCYSKNLNRWLTFRDETNKAIVSVKDNNQDLGLVTVSVYREGTEPVILNSSNGSYNNGVGNCYLHPELAMKRHFAVSTEKTFSQAVDVRLYFSDSELQSLITTSTVPPANPFDGCATADDVNNINQLYVTKYSGPNVDGNYTNNVAAVWGGLYRMFGANVTTPNTAFDAVSSAGFSTLFTGSPDHHYLQMHVTEFSEFWLHGSEEIYPLPVDMIYLEANAINNSYIRLTWATALEVNNAGFNVERSLDGQTWQQIGFVEGHDNSTVQNDYSYNDMNVTAGIRYYYRLKQIDNDGQFEYTDVVSAILTGDITFSVKDFVPNPAGDKTTLLITAATNQELNIELFNIVGQKVSGGIHAVNKGLNRLEFDVSTLASGTYSAVVYSGNETFTKKLVITK